MGEDRNATFEKLDQLTIGAEQQSDALQRCLEEQNETLAALNSILRGFDENVVEIQATMKVSQVSGSSVQAANKCKYNIT